MLIAILLRLPWLEVLGEAWKVIRQVTPGRSFEGMYEVLNYESTLELKDARAKRAPFTKREKVRYLQDNIIAYQDQAWGDGEILLDFRCTPGTPVDRYRSSHKTYILISRRDIQIHQIHVPRLILTPGSGDWVLTAVSALQVLAGPRDTADRAPSVCGGPAKAQIG